MDEDAVYEPFPIFEVSERYLIYDVDIAMHLRRKHNVCGTLIGNIPQANQQNFFSGLPLELMSEEARLLVDQGHAYIVDDTMSNLDGFQNLSLEERANFREILRNQGLEASTAIQRQADARKIRGLAKMERKKRKKARESNGSMIGKDQDDTESLFGTSVAPSTTSKDLQPQLVTPTTSYPPLTSSLSIDMNKLPRVPSSYPLFAHLHCRGYFMLPGLRFGCQYSCYPGDPLRFHSHFLAVGYDWDEDINLLDIVGGGRLGTGVKKGYLIGGVDPDKESIEEGESSVRTFCFEWAAM